MRRRWLRRLCYGLLGIVILLALPVLYIHGLCRGGTGIDIPAAQDHPAAIEQALRAAGDYRRDEARSFLTFPEWYIVFTSQDYARYIAANRPSGFRYFASAFAFWTNYCAVNRYVTPRYAFHSEFHIVDYVIGMSHSVEFIVKGLYENTIGRLSEVFAPDAPTAEERFAATLFAAYGGFLRTTPWYEYPFAEKRKELSTQVETSGPGTIRKWERRFALSTELAVKSVYAELIRGGTQSAFEAPVLTTVAIVRNLPRNLLSGTDNVHVLAEADGMSVVSFPRYAPFADLVLRLAATDTEFVEIAGNNEILITVLATDAGAPMPPDAQEVFRADLLSGEDGSRIGLAVPVPALMRTIRALTAAGHHVEHVYDY
jgi:hypothetical protein